MSTPAWVQEIDAMVDDGVEVRIRVERGEYYVAAFGRYRGEVNRRLALVRHEVLWMALSELSRRVSRHPRTEAKAAVRASGTGEPTPPMPGPVMVECEECGGEGERQAVCEDCQTRLTTENQDADDPARCNGCATRQEPPDAMRRRRARAR